MKVKVNAIAMLTMMTVGFTTVATSCSNNDDVPASYQPSVLAKSLEGEWIVEQSISGTRGFEQMAGDKYLPQEADQYTLIYHFNNDGTGWKEFDLLNNGQVESILISRYESQFNYMVNNQNMVILNYTDGSGKPTGQMGDLLFDGKTLTDKVNGTPVPLNPSTEAQINKYKSEADAWHGGSDDAAVGHALSAAAVGEIIGSDGKAYAATAKNSLPAGVRAVAMIAYVGRETDDEIYKRGLAIALADEGCPMIWSTSNSYCSNKPRIDNCKWRMPSLKDWQYMFIGCGSGESYSEPSPSMVKNCSALANKLSAVGGTPLQNDIYWTSSEEFAGRYAWYLRIDGGSARSRLDYKTRFYRVRACLVF